MINLAWIPTAVLHLHRPGRHRLSVDSVASHSQLVGRTCPRRKYLRKNCLIGSSEAEAGLGVLVMSPANSFTIRLTLTTVQEGVYSTRAPSLCLTWGEDPVSAYISLAARGCEGERENRLHSPKELRADFRYRSSSRFSYSSFSRSCRLFSPVQHLHDLPSDLILPPRLIPNSEPRPNSN